MTEFPIAGVDRPMTSHEIQAAHGRMPTREERQAFGRWRSNNPDVPLSAEDARRSEEAAQAEADRWRYLPASSRALDELEKAIGEGAAEKVKTLIEAMIAERHDR